MLKDAIKIGGKVSRRFLETPHLLYNNTIHYAEINTWLGTLPFELYRMTEDLRYREMDNPIYSRILKGYQRSLRRYYGVLTSA